MWEKFKEKLLDILFYEEHVEDKPKKKGRKKKKKVKKTLEKNTSHQVSELIRQPFVREVAKKEVRSRQQSFRIKEQVDGDARVLYQYPKKNEPIFPFPAIPDDKVNRKENIQLVKEEKNKKNSTKPVRKRTQKDRVSQNKTVDIISPSYTKEDLENVPAFMRRRQKRVRQDQEEQREEKVSQEEKPSLVKEKFDLSQSTRPEELDRLFNRIKKKPRIEDLRNESKEKLNMTTDLLNPPEERKEVSEEKLVTPPLEEAASPKKEGADEYNVTEDFVADLLTEADISEELQEEEAATTIMQEAFKSAKAFGNPEQEEAAEETYKHEPTEVVREKEVVPDYLLNDPIEATDRDEDWVIEQQILLEQTLEHFNIDAEVVNITQGPAVTRFEVQPALGVKVSRIRNLSDDFKLNMAAKDIRIEAPIPGKNTIGIEVPNRFPQVVTLQQLIETEEFKHATSPLSVALGLTIEGEPLITDIGEMPHGLIAGATGSGKSVCINTILLSLLYKAHYDEVKFLLIDPKMVELAPYNGIPHLISPVITDVKAATMALKWAVEEMDKRYEKFVEARVRNIASYNEKMSAQHEEKMPFIVIVIDELADLMMVAPQDVEDSICRIAQKARACGIHLLIATQRPSVDVVTGLIKANIPTRIAFSVSSQVDSRTMIDTVGAEKLLGKGDMLFVENGANKSVRLQGPFVSDEEIDRVASFMRQTAEPNYLFEQEQLLLDLEEEKEDELLHEVIHFVVENGQASTSLLQRRFRIGYNRAARLIDTLEMRGIVSEQNGSKPRDVLVNATQLKQ